MVSDERYIQIRINIIEFIINLIRKQKMKKMKIASLAFGALMLGLTSCSNDFNGSEQGSETGEKTYMSITLDFPHGGATRSVADENGTEEEATVKSVDVFICLPGSGAVTHHALSIADFTADENTNKYTATTKIPTTTGAKVVYAGVNLPTGIASLVANEADLKALPQSLGRAQLTTVANGIPMFSSAVASTFVAEKDGVENRVALSAKRMVAKVTVEKSVSLKQEGVAGKLGKLEFAVNNFNNKSFLVQGLAPDFKDPNWNVYTAADFESFGKEYTDYIEIVEKQADVTALKAQYAAENTSELHRKKEITRVTVRSTFIPAIVTSVVAADFVTAENTKQTPETFWMVTDKAKNETHCFYVKRDAEAFANYVSGKVVEYENGYCYWDLFLNKGHGNTGKQWDVVRNEFFRCTISRIITPGRETPELPEGGGDETPDEDTNIFTDIQVLNWNTPVLGDYVLVP